MIQMEIYDFGLEKFKCRISDKLFENRYEHDMKCIYQFCKKGWVFSETNY